jgi:hypothetical protein
MNPFQVQLTRGDSGIFEKPIWDVVVELYVQERKSMHVPCTLRWIMGSDWAVPNLA